MRPWQSQSNELSIYAIVPLGLSLTLTPNTRFIACTISLTWLSDSSKAFLSHRAQIDFDDLFDATGADLHRHAEVIAADAVLAFEQRGAGQNFFLVEKKRLGHLNRRRRR